MRDVLKGKPPKPDTNIEDAAAQELQAVKEADAVVLEKMEALRTYRNVQLGALDPTSMTAEKMKEKVATLEGETNQKIELLRKRLSGHAFVAKDDDDDACESAVVPKQKKHKEKRSDPSDPSRLQPNHQNGKINLEMDSDSCSSESTSEGEDEVANVNVKKVESKKCVWPHAFKKPKKCKQALLILQSAGEFKAADLMEETIMDDPDDKVDPDNQPEAAYLKGSVNNYALVREFYITQKHIDQANIKVYDYSVAVGEEEPKDVIKSFLEEHKDKHRIIYYSGHGRKDGAWAFCLYGKKADGKTNREVYVKREDMEEWVKEFPAESGKEILVISQSCCSGKWCKTNKFWVISSAGEVESSMCTSKGSKVTRFFFDDTCSFDLGDLGSTPYQNFNSNKN